MADRVEGANPHDTFSKPLHRLSDTAIKTRVHWLDNVELVGNRVGISTTSPQPRYHLLKTPGEYRALCGNVYRSNMNVHIASKAPIEGRTPCKKCTEKKRKMLRAARALEDNEVKVSAP